MKSDSGNISHNVYVTNVYGFYDITLGNQIQSQLLWEDLHLAPDIFFSVNRYAIVDGQYAGFFQGGKCSSHPDEKLQKRP